MASSILIAGIGNIFQGDDAFGVIVAQRLLGLRFSEGVRVLDVGIRSFDLGFALLGNYDFIILVDATSRGCKPGTLYTIEIEPDDIPDVCEKTALINSHALDPVHVLSLAKSMGAQFRKIVLIGCEPLVIDCDGSGYIGLSEVVEAAMSQAVETIRQIIEEIQQTSDCLLQEEVLHEPS